MNDNVEYPSFIARFYDAIYARVRDGVDNRFFLDEIARAGGKVLEIGVGTGRIFAEARRNGADIYGLDVSRCMIEKLKEKIPPEDQGRLWIQNAAAMQLPVNFSLVIAPFRVLSHLITVEDQIECLNRVWEHLEPGGRFIFDLFVPNLSMLITGIQNLQDFEGEYEPGRRLRRIVSMNADLIRQISHVTMECMWDEGGTERSASWTFDMRFYFRYELEHLVRLSKLTLETIYGDYERGALVEGSKDFVVVCRRK